MKLTLLIRDFNRQTYGLSCNDLLEKNGFNRNYNDLLFGNNEYFRLLELVGDKYPLMFLPFVEMTKREMDKEKAFVLKCTSTLAMKHLIGSFNNTKNPFIDNKKCFTNESDPFRVCVHPQIGIKGSVNWKPNYFKTTEYNPELIITEDLKNLIEENSLAGFHFEPLGHLTQGIVEDVYCVTADSLMQNKFIESKLCRIQDRDDYQCKYINYDGSLIYTQGSLDEIKDISYTNKATSVEKGEMIVSQKFRQFYIQNKLKGIRFEPVFEMATNSFEWYNQTISELANDVMKYNSEHVIGQLNKVNPSTLLNGVLPD